MKNLSSNIFVPPDQQNPNIEAQEEKARCDWDFNLRTVVSTTKFADVSDTLGVIEFDPSDNFIATGGIARKIRLYTINSLLPPPPPRNDDDDDDFVGAINLLDHGNVCDYCITTPAKLSSLKWKPGSGGKLLGSGDYDGVITEYDLERKLPIFERDEHGGRRVWSMDYSHSDPGIGASGSDDGTMQMWDPRVGDGGKCLAVVTPSATRSSVCCVEFNPFGGSIVAVGCADRRVYLYDVRKVVEPWMVLEGHQKAVTYVKFLECNTMVTSGIDGCLKMWCTTAEQCLIRTYKGHVNARRFVGLSVWRSGGLLSCGSETNQVFVYDKRWGQPVWVYGFQPPLVRAGLDSVGGSVSTVCWRQQLGGEDHCTLVAGGSDGVLHVFQGIRR